METLAFPWYTWLQDQKEKIGVMSLHPLDPVGYSFTYLGCKKFFPCAFVFMNVMFRFLVKCMCV